MTAQLEQLTSNPTIRVASESVSIAAIVGTILGYLPAIAALMSILWYCWLFYSVYLQKKKEREQEQNKDKQ